MNKVVIGIIGLLLIALGRVQWQSVSYKHRWQDAEANIKAYSSMLDNAGNESTALKLSVEQLEYFKDSVLIELDKTRKELGIKDKRLKSLQQVQSSFTRTDTLVFKDTVLLSPQVDIDTLLRDDWYSLRIGLQYPSTVVVTPRFKSDKHIVVSTRKETVNPPKKFFLFRWFQKKHTVLQVDVVEKNPYVEQQTSRYVEIMK